MEMQTVLLVASYAPSLRNFREDLLLALKEKYFSVHIAAPDIDEEMMSYFESVDVIPHTISLARNGLNPLVDIKTIRQLVMLQSSIKAAYVIAYTVKPVIYVGLSLWLRRSPMYIPLITGLGFLFQPKNSVKDCLVSKLSFAIYRLSLKRAQLVLFQNSDDRSDLLRLNILNSKTKTAVINGSGVNLTKFQYKNLNCISSGVKFLFIGRLITDKGLCEYVEAAKIVKGSFPSSTFCVVGWVDTNPSSICQEQLDLWIENYDIEFLGNLDDVRPALEDCSVYVLPSYREGTPRTVLEAMAVGRAIITTDAPGCRETVREGENGFLVPVKDAQSLAKVMIRFIENPELIIRFGKNSRLIAEEKYDSKDVAAEILRLIQLQS